MLNSTTHSNWIVCGSKSPCGNRIKIGSGLRKKLLQKWEDRKIYLYDVFSAIVYLINNFNINYCWGHREMEALVEIQSTHRHRFGTIKSNQLKIQLIHLPAFDILAGNVLIKLDWVITSLFISVLYYAVHVPQLAPHHTIRYNKKQMSKDNNWRLFY